MAYVRLYEFALPLPYKYCAHRLHLRGYSNDEISDILLVSDRSVRRWLVNINDFGEVHPPDKQIPGPRRALTGDQLRAITETIIRQPDLYLDELHLAISVEHDAVFSMKTLARYLDQLGLTRKRLHREAAQRDEEERAEWQRMYQKGIIARQIVTVDESSKNERTLLRTHGRAPTGLPATISESFQRGQRFSILPAMTVEGYISVRVVEDSIDLEEFTDFIVEDVVRIFQVEFYSNTDTG